MNPAEPQNDRELLLKLNLNVETLAESINNFGRTLKELEEKKIGDIQARVEGLEKKWTQVSGGWKLVVVIWSVLTAVGFFGLLKYFK